MAERFQQQSCGPFGLSSDILATLVTQIKERSDELDQSLVDVNALGDPAEKEGRIQRTLYLHERYVRDLHFKIFPVYSPATGSILSDLPIEHLMTLKVFLDKTIPDCHPSISADWEMNYGFMATIYRGMVSKTSLPYLEMRNAFQHPVLYHEAGHMIDLHIQITSKVLEGVKLDKQTLEEFWDKTKTMPIPLAPGPSQSGQQLSFEQIIDLGEIVKVCTLILNDWVQEAVADIIATHLLGPAYLFAFLDLATLVGPLVRYSDSHPTPIFRLRLILNELESIGFKFKDPKTQPNALDLIGDFLRAVYSLTDLLDSPKDPSPYTIVEKSLHQGEHHLQTQVRSICSTFTYPVTKYEEQVPKLRTHILNGIAPCELSPGTPATVPGIFNAGWEVKLCHMPTFFHNTNAVTPLQQRESTRDLSELLLKAIEASEVLRAKSRRASSL